MILHDRNSLLPRSLKQTAEHAETAEVFLYISELCALRVTGRVDIRFR